MNIYLLKYFIGDTYNVLHFHICTCLYEEKTFSSLKKCHLSNDNEKFKVALCNLFYKGKSCGLFIQPIVILAFMH